MSLRALDAGRIALRPDQDEVVVHHRIALHAEAVGDEFLLLRLGVHEHHVGVAAPAGVERLAGALRDHLHVDAGLGLEQRQDVAEQAGVLGRGGRGDDDRLVLRGRGGRGGKQRERRRMAIKRDGGSCMMALLRSDVLGCSDQQLAGDEPAGLLASSVRRRNSAAGPLSTMRPRCISTISPASRRASPRSCVDITTLMPRAATARITSSIALVAAGSRLAVGSSRNSTSGSRASARASASRCCSPPESRRAGRSPKSGEADEGEQFVDACRPFAARRRRRSPAHSEVGGGAAAKHDRPLEHDGAAQRRRMRAAAPGDAPAGRLDQAHGDAQQRGLAGAVRPDQHGRRAGRSVSETRSRIVTSRTA